MLSWSFLPLQFHISGYTDGLLNLPIQTWDKCTGEDLFDFSQILVLSWESIESQMGKNRVLERAAQEPELLEQQMVT